MKQGRYNMGDKIVFASFFYSIQQEDYCFWWWFWNCYVFMIFTICKFDPHYRAFGSPLITTVSFCGVTFFVSFQFLFHVFFFLENLFYFLHWDWFFFLFAFFFFLMMSLMCAGAYLRRCRVFSL